jgi:acetyl esterase
MAQIHPQIAALLAGEEPEAPDPGPAELAAMRAGYAQTARELGGVPLQVASVRDVLIARPDAPALPVRVYRPTTPAEPLGAVVWHHGGGWVMGDLDGIDHVARELCEVSGQVVVSVDYRLAPEHQFPAAVDDARAALRWTAVEAAQELGIDPRRVAVGGDSAGGQLAAQAALREPGLAAAQLLVYPALDPRMATASYREFAAGPWVTAAEMAYFWTSFRGDASVEALELPALGDAPPAWIAVAEHDPLRDDGVAYAAALREAGVPAQLVVHEDMTHSFLRWGGVVDRAHDVIAWLAAALR